MIHALGVLVCEILHSEHSQDAVNTLHEMIDRVSPTPEMDRMVQAARRCLQALLPAGRHGTRIGPMVADPLLWAGAMMDVSRALAEFHWRRMCGAVTEAKGAA